ncbi:MAG: hypothetical protein Q9173_000238 [Seirophora scorigena]
MAASCADHAVQDSEVGVYAASPRHRDNGITDSPSVGAHTVTTLEHGTLTQDPHAVQDGPAEDYFVDIDGVPLIDCIDLISDSTPALDSAQGPD